MNKLIALLLFTFSFATVPAFAGRGPAQAQSNSEGSSRSGRGINGCKACQIPWFELSFGSANFTQTLDETHSAKPPGYKISAHQKFGPFHLGVSVLGAVQSEMQQGGHLEPGEHWRIHAHGKPLSAGFLIGNFLILDAGFGYAQMRRSVSNPYATGSSTVNTTANGTGYNVGGTVIPIRTKAVSLGVSYYYFEAKTTGYDQDSVIGSTQNKTKAPAKVKSAGTLAMVSLLFNF